MITTMMNKFKRVLTDSVSCPTMEIMRGSRNFHERASNENSNFWSQTRRGSTLKKSRNYLFKVKFSNSRGGGGSGPPVPPSGSAHGDPRAPNILLKSGAKEKHQLNPDWPSNRQEAWPQPTKMNSFMSGPS